MAFEIVSFEMNYHCSAMQLMNGFQTFFSYFRARLHLELHMFGAQYPLSRIDILDTVVRSLFGLCEGEVEEQGAPEGDAAEGVPPLQVRPHPLVDGPEPVHGAGQLIFGTN